jgi:DNA-directed RNA polymerase subunit RPC12/RpoP
MGIKVTCKICGNVIVEHKASRFEKFDLYALPNKCLKCGHKLEKENPEMIIEPVKNIPTKKRRSDYGKMHYYVYRLSPWLVEKDIRCKYCDDGFKLGELVVSVRTHRGRRRHFHNKCYEKYWCKISKDFEISQLRLCANKKCWKIPQVDNNTETLNPLFQAEQRKNV